MSLLNDPPPALPLLHWIAATVLANAVAVLIFVGWLYGPMFFGEGALGMGALPAILGPYALGGLLPSFFLVWKTQRSRLAVTTSVWLGIVMAAVLAVMMALYASYLSGESSTGYLVKVFTAQFFIVMAAGALSGAAVWYYLNWVRGKPEVSNA
jgi:hypothetical protein